MEAICFEWKVGGYMVKYSQVIGWERHTRKKIWWWNKFQSEIASKLTCNSKETASNSELNMEYWSRKTKIVFSFKTYSIKLGFMSDFEKSV